jgi:hypothetical protein
MTEETLEVRAYQDYMRHSIAAREVPENSAEEEQDDF